MSTYLPGWLFDAYVRLFDALQEEIFTFEDAGGILGIKHSSLAAILSELGRRHYLFRFGRRGRRRLYRLLSPEDALFSYVNLENLGRIKEERYVHILVKASRSLHRRYGEGLTSLCLYGSVARGTATETSDVDLLVVADLEGSLGERLEKLYGSMESIRDERSFLYRRGIYTDVSLYPLTRSEASRFLPLYLDIAEEGVILYDRQGFLRRVLLQCRALVERRGGRRLCLGDRWIWKLDPNMEVGQRIEV